MFLFEPKKKNLHILWDSSLDYGSGLPDHVYEDFFPLYLTWLFLSVIYVTLKFFQIMAITNDQVTFNTGLNKCCMMKILTLISQIKSLHI